MSPRLGKAAQALGDPAAGRGDAFAGEVLADDFGQFVQRAARRQFPGVFAAAQQQRFFLVELVLDLADQFLEDVFQRDHADRAAVFVHDDGEVEFSLQEKLEQFFQPGGFRDVDQFARHGAPGPAALRFGADGEKVLDMDHAEGLVQVAALAERETRVAGFFGHFQAFAARWPRCRRPRFPGAGA